MDALGNIFTGLDRNPSLSAYAAAATKLRELAPPLPELRVGILSNHTFEIETTLEVECARRGFKTIFYQAGYDQYRQELLSAGGGLDGFRPDAVLVSLDLESTFPGISLSTSAYGNLPAAREWLAGFEALLSGWRRRSPAPVFVHDFIPPAWSMDGLLGAAVFDWTMELNAGLRRMAAEMEGVFVPAAAQAASADGLAGWRDPRFWYLARVGINAKKFPILAMRLARCLAALRRPAAKCLVFDLDNTIWGGVLGDAGPEGILCAGSDYPAGAYADFQRALLALRSRGILLAVASKNDWALVEEAFRVRGDMPLRPEHIAGWEVHWNPKPESLDRIARRLNIGMDSLVFLDDNPAEIDLIRMARPSVRAHLMPPRPEAFASFLSKLEDFDQLRLSDEDRRRAELYQLRARQAEMAASATDLESFYRSLRTVLAPERAGPANFDRIVQLIQKTNQFNLTTRRHEKNALSERVGHGSELWGFRASDVHGDHGLIAVALLDFEGGTCGIDTLLMSCRVIGRTLETAILHFLELRAIARGARQMRGEYLATAKNGPCREFYKQHGFSVAAEDDRRTEWFKNLENRTGCPEWITISGELTEVCAKT